MSQFADYLSHITSNGGTKIRNLIIDVLDKQVKPIRQKMDGQFVVDAIPYTPSSLIEEIFDKIEPIKNRCLDTKIAVIYTIEMAIYLSGLGFTDITLITREQDDRMERGAIKFGYKYVLEQDVKNMKFDIMIGNPPWKNPNTTGRGSGALDTIFYERMFKHTTYSACIMSSSWMAKRSSTFRMNTLNDPMLKEIINTTDFFDVKTSSVCLIRDAEYNSNLCFLDGIETNKLDITSIKSDATLPQLPMPNGSLANIYFRGPAEVPAGTLLDVGIYDCISTIGRDVLSEYPIIKKTNVDIHQPYVQRWKVVLNAAGLPNGLGGLKIAPPNVSASNSAIVLMVNSKQEALNLQTLLQTKLYKQLIANSKHTNYNSKNVFESLPMIDLSKSWTDEELYKHFNIKGN